MKLTVIVLAYNVEKYVREALDSIVMQKVNFPYEIIIGNDGSTDGTVAILEEYKKKYDSLIKLNIIPRTPRKGSGDYINFASIFQNVKSEYFCVLDGDDFWTDEYKLQKQIDFLDQNKDFTVCGHNYWLLYEDGKKQKAYDSAVDKTNYKFASDNFVDLLINGALPYMQTSSLMYRNIFAEDAAMKSKFFTPRYAADLIRTLVHAEKGRAKYLNEIMSTYRICSGGEWNRYDEIKKAKQHVDFFIYHKKHTFLKSQSRFLNIAILQSCDQLLRALKPVGIKKLPIFLYTKFTVHKTKIEQIILKKNS